VQFTRNTSSQQYFNEAQAYVGCTILKFYNINLKVINIVLAAVNNKLYGSLIEQ